MLNIPEPVPEQFCKQIEHATEDELRAARRRHCHDSDNEIEIDEPAEVLRADTGTWVRAWVWIPNEEE